MSAAGTPRGEPPVIQRLVAVLARRPTRGAAPPGVDPDAFFVATVNDVLDLVDDMARVQAVLARSPPGRLPDGLSWPTVVDGADEIAVFDALAELAAPAAAAAAGAHAAVAGTSREQPADPGARSALELAEGIVVAADAPDLPGILLAKLYQALGGADVAACPAEGGGLVALGCTLPAPRWLRSAGVGLDTADALEQLAAAAPGRRAFAVGPGWHRLRTVADIARLDPELEGWPATRALLEGRTGPRRR